MPKRADHHAFGFAQPHHRLSALAQQRTQAAIDFRVPRQQFAEIAGLVESLLVMAHARSSMLILISTTAGPKSQLHVEGA